MANNLFDIKIGYASFKNSIAIASMAGTTDSTFASEFANAGFVVLGGYNLDTETNEAARKELERGRQEFVSDAPMEREINRDYCCHKRTRRIASAVP